MDGRCPSVGLYVLVVRLVWGENSSEGWMVLTHRPLAALSLMNMSSELVVDRHVKRRATTLIPTRLNK